MAEQARGRGRPAKTTDGAPEPELAGDVDPVAAEPGVPPVVVEQPAAAALIAPRPPVVPEPLLIAGPAEPAPQPRPAHLGYFNADVSPPEPITDLAAVFESVPGMATLRRTRCRVIERHLVPNTRAETTDRLVFHRGVQVALSRVDAMVAAAARDRTG